MKIDQEKLDASRRVTEEGDVKLSDISVDELYAKRYFSIERMARLEEIQGVKHTLSVACHMCLFYKSGRSRDETLMDGDGNVYPPGAPRPSDEVLEIMDGQGECRRYPPLDWNSKGAIWPIVNWNDACGEFHDHAIFQETFLWRGREKASKRLKKARRAMKKMARTK